MRGWYLSGPSNERLMAAGGDPERRIGCREWQPIYHFALLVTRFRAGDGVRTHDIQLGKLALYQLSYARVRRSIPPGARPIKPAHPRGPNAP